MTVFTRSRTFAAGVVLGLLALTPVPGSPASGALAAGRTGADTYNDQRIEFEPGTDNATRAGDVRPGVTDRWILRARAGQTMQVMVDSVEDDTVFAVFGPGRSVLGSVNSYTEDEEMYWTGTLPADMDYAIEVTTVGPATHYEIKVAIDAAVWVPLGQLERLSFAPGSVSGRASAAALLGTADSWYLGARAGQFMAVDVTSLEANSTFDVFAPDGTMMTAPGERTTWSGVLPQDGDYRVEVRPTRGNATYTIAATITNGPSQAPPPAPPAPAEPSHAGGPNESGGTSAHVYFEAGSDHAQIQMSIAPGAEDHWIVTAAAGQTLSVLMQSDLGLDITVTATDPFGEPLASGELEFDILSLPASGDYDISVFNSSTIVGAYDLWIYIT
jgi:hypothetical protein